MLEATIRSLEEFITYMLGATILSPAELTLYMLEENPDIPLCKAAVLCMTSMVKSTLSML